MNTLTVEVETTRIESVRTTARELKVTFADGRAISVPLNWFPRLAHGTPKERANWSLIGRGHGIHWPELDEDLSVECLLSGKQSGESERSFKRWLEKRAGT